MIRKLSPDGVYIGGFGANEPTLLNRACGGDKKTKFTKYKIYFKNFAHYLIHVTSIYELMTGMIKLAVRAGNF